MFSFWSFTKFYRKAFESPLIDYIWLAERSKIYTFDFQGSRKQVLCKTRFEKFLKNSIKLLNSPFTVMLQTAFTERAIKEHMDMKRTLERQSEVTWTPEGHSKHSGARGTCGTSFSRLGNCSFLTQQLAGKSFGCAFGNWIRLSFSNLSASLKL